MRDLSACLMMRIFARITPANCPASLVSTSTVAIAGGECIFFRIIEDEAKIASMPEFWSCFFFLKSETACYSNLES